MLRRSDPATSRTNASALSRHAAATEGLQSGQAPWSVVADKASCETDVETTTVRPQRTRILLRTQPHGHRTGRGSAITYICKWRQGDSNPRSALRGPKHLLRIRWFHYADGSTDGSFRQKSRRQEARSAHRQRQHHQVRPSYCARGRSPSHPRAPSLSVTGRRLQAALRRRQCTPVLLRVGPVESISVQVWRRTGV